MFTESCYRKEKLLPAQANGSDHYQLSPTRGDLRASLTAHSCARERHRSQCLRGFWCNPPPRWSDSIVSTFRDLFIRVLSPHPSTGHPRHLCRKYHGLSTYPSLRGKARPPPTHFTRKRSRNAGLARKTWTVTLCSEPGWTRWPEGRWYSEIPWLTVVAKYKTKQNNIFSFSYPNATPKPASLAVGNQLRQEKENTIRPFILKQTGPSVSARRHITHPSREALARQLPRSLGTEQH